ncbi:MAG: 4Fe-4S dicluster domain-containing protein [Candidatus Wallbacteria bacterium]|nr:4Fe-4S dicluster domain-containing protein [Candidatus Wallbacteria bacterium]
MPRLTRRQVLAGSAKLAGFGAGVGLAQSLLRPARPGYPVPAADGLKGVVRPPGAVEEEAFLAACIRCYRCQDACEPGAIRMFAEGAGRHQHTPYVDAAVRGCTLCMKCTAACPAGVLAPMRRRERAQARMATIELREDLCLSHKAKRLRAEQSRLREAGQPATEATAAVERRGPCGECYMVCPLREKAIQLEPGSFLAPVVFPAKCAGCGLCEEICRAIVRGEPAIRVVPTRWMT